MWVLCVQPCGRLAPPLGEWPLSRAICPLLFTVGFLIFVLGKSNQNVLLHWGNSVTGKVLKLYSPAISPGAMTVFTLLTLLCQVPKYFLNFIPQKTSSLRKPYWDQLISKSFSLLFIVFLKWPKSLCFYSQHILVLEFSAKEVERGTFWIKDESAKALTHPQEMLLNVFYQVPLFYWN